MEKAVDRWSTEMPDLVVLDLNVEHEERMELYQKFRAVSVARNYSWSSPSQCIC